jgi:hypothetical protein
MQKFQSDSRFALGARLSRSRFAWAGFLLFVATVGRAWGVSLNVYTVAADCGGYFATNVTAGPEYAWYGVQYVGPSGNVASSGETTSGTQS